MIKYTTGTFGHRSLRGKSLNEISDADIRIGIQIANELANEERKRQLVKAPLSTEEEVFANKNQPIR